MANVVQQKSDSSNVLPFLWSVNTEWLDAEPPRERERERETFLITPAVHFSYIGASAESDCESELSPAFLLSMLSTQLTQKIIPVCASRSSSQFSPRCSITRYPILDCIHHAAFRRTSDGCAFLNKLLTTGTKTHWASAQTKTDD